MKLTLKNVWSPDLKPPSDAVPPDVMSFSVFVQASIEDERGDAEVFRFTVASRDAVKDGFVYQTLVLDQFSWTDIRGFVQYRLDTLGASATTWKEVIRTLTPMMAPSDMLPQAE